MRKAHLLHSTVRGYRPSVRLGRHGHPMRDPEGHTPTPSPSPSGDNTGGNSGAPSGESNNNNNGGQEFDLTAFWASPSDGTSASPQSGESAGSGESSGGQQQQQQGQGQQPSNPVEQLGKDIGALSFANPMTPEVMQQLSEGNTEGYQTAMNQMGQQAVQHAIRLMLPILGQVRDGLRTEIQGGIKSNNTTRENESALLEAIPSAANPAVRPIVDSIFTRAMQLTKNDRKVALGMTKDMLKLQMQTMGGDVGMPPPTSGDGFAGGSNRNINWADELLGRG